MILTGLFIIFACLFAGYALSALTGIPAPGPVLGMGLLLVVLLVWRPKRDNSVMRGADALLAKMSIFFVPAGVGVIAYFGELQAAPVAVAVGMVLPWLVALVVGAGTALLTLKLLGLFSRKGARSARPAAAPRPGARS